MYLTRKCVTSLLTVNSRNKTTCVMKANSLCMDVMERLMCLLVCAARLHVMTSEPLITRVCQGYMNVQIGSIVPQGLNIINLFHTVPGHTSLDTWHRTTTAGVWVFGWWASWTGVLTSCYHHQTDRLSDKHECSTEVKTVRALCNIWTVMCLLLFLSVNRKMVQSIQNIKYDLSAVRLCSNKTHH